MRRDVCLHGHFYQPDRADPWTRLLPREPSAAPFHDWNDRIAAECYRPNAAARVLRGDGRIDRVLCNYERISWNFGPSLLGWLERHEPWTYARLLEADAAGAVRFDGHGPALAQPWVHAILPLADDRDKQTLVRWGCRDFERRFGRVPEGMWLPEAAVDTATLESLAAAGIAFTVLAPWQVAAVHPPSGPWRGVDGGVDTTRPYRCRLPSGRSIDLFFYDGAISAGIAFQGWLNDGTALADRMLGAFPDPAGRPASLVHAATDGESYGHHHRFGEMALAATLDRLDRDPSVHLTVYGEHLATQPPTWGARLAEPTAWSCAHGVERWRSDCGCQTGGPPGWHQSWRAPLRAGLDWLRAELAEVFEQRGGALLDDVWAARDEYESLLGLPIDLDDDARHAAELAFVAAQGGPAAQVDEILGLLEMQRHVLSAFESSAWFFADAAGLETVLALRHAARAMDWCRSVTGASPEAAFVERLRPMLSNDPAEGDGSRIWLRHVRVDADDAVPGVRHDPRADLVTALDALARLVAEDDAAELDRVLDVALCAYAEELALDPTPDVIDRGRALVRLATALRGADAPGRWWVQNAVVALRDGPPIERAGEQAVEQATQLAALAAEVGVAMP